MKEGVGILRKDHPRCNQRQHQEGHEAEQAIEGASIFLRPFVQAHTTLAHQAFKFFFIGDKDSGNVIPNLFRVGKGRGEGYALRMSTARSFLRPGLGTAM